MSNEIRVRQNFIGGLVDTADLAAAGTTLNSAALAAIATTIDTTNHMPITLDPDGIYGAPEIAYITALTVGATSCTLLRGQEGTTARQHLLDTPWVHGPTVDDITQEQDAVVSTSETSTSATYADLATVGPQVTATPGPQGKLIILMSSTIASSLAGTSAYISAALSGGNTLAASDANGGLVQPGINNGGGSVARVLILSGLTRSATTVKMQYRVGGGATGTWSCRSLVVIPA